MWALTAWLCNRKIALLLARKAQVEFEHSQLLDMAKEREAAHCMLGIPVEVTFRDFGANKAHQASGMRALRVRPPGTLAMHTKDSAVKPIGKVFPV